MEDRPLWKRIAEGVDDYHLDMIALGFDLMRTMSNMTRSPSFHDTVGLERETPARARNSAMKVGLSIGPVAGIVLGSCRRFYCIYGMFRLATTPKLCCFKLLRADHQETRRRLSPIESLPQKLVFLVGLHILAIVHKLLKTKQLTRGRRYCKYCGSHVQVFEFGHHPGDARHWRRRQSVHKRILQVGITGLGFDKGQGPNGSI